MSALHACVRGERTSGLVHIILNRIFPGRVLLPPSFRSLFPLTGSRFGRKSAASLRARLFVLERHCSGDAEAMSQRRCPSLRPPATHCSIIKWLLLCHLASFPWWYLYSHVAVDVVYSTSLSFFSVGAATAVSFTPWREIGSLSPTPKLLKHTVS